jgi:uncharacterized membrane protein
MMIDDIIVMVLLLVFVFVVVGIRVKGRSRHLEDRGQLEDRAASAEAARREPPRRRGRHERAA